jgi:wyosine [tRNA(Phe)-imidazoG37] synthetase (radical SAM superfamily)
LKNPNITVTPNVHRKGFKSENLKMRSITANDLLVQKRLSTAKRGLKKLSREDNEILAIIEESYERHLNNKPLLKDGFLLSGHELLEFDNLNDEQTGRYFLYRYKYNMYPKLKKVGAFPPCLQIEPTSVCNFRCIMCYQCDSTFNKKSDGYMGNMSLELFKDIVDEVQGQIEALTFSSRGEPLLNENLPEMLNYCEDKFLGLKLNTNASLLTEKNIHTLLSSHLQTLVFSIDAAEKEAYETIRVNSNFEKLIDNLELFSKIRSNHYQDSKLIVRISGVKINNDQDIEKMNALWSRYADIIAFTNYTPWESSYDNQQNELATPCSELWLRMFVWWDGKINPCDFDYKSTLSNSSFTNVSISEAWNSEWFQALRQKHLAKERGHIEPCKRCIAT